MAQHRRGVISQVKGAEMRGEAAERARAPSEEAPKMTTASTNSLC